MRLLQNVALILIILAGAGLCIASEAELDPYVSVIRTQGQNPVAAVRDALAKRDLIIFDDAIHSAKEPFDFYTQLLRDPEIQKTVKYVFVEVFSMAAQPQLDAYFSAAQKNPQLLLKVFQDDYSGFGWRYQTYLDLLSAVWDINSKLPEDRRIKVIGVDEPIYWEALHTRQDYDLFQDSLLGRDYFLYKTILEKLDRFSSGKKAFFLTNTRHGYKHLRGKDGQLFWNCATFFDQFNPGKTWSVRIHNVTLIVEAAVDHEGKKSTEGLEDVQYRWDRVENGNWDKAFAAAGNAPVAIPLIGNAFGNARYEGNLMLYARADQVMSDAYDAVIFLAPLEKLHLSAEFGFIFTESFRTEVKRRIQLMQEGQMDSFLKENGAGSVDAFIESLAAGEPEKPNPFVKPLN